VPILNCTAWKILLNIVPVVGNAGGSCVGCDVESFGSA
jgi:hypothetical protein